MTTSYKHITERVGDLLAQANYIVAKCRVDGNLTFDGHHKTVEETDNESRCRTLCLRIERALETCRVEEITSLLEMYELLYRLGYGKQPSYGEPPSQNIGYGKHPSYGVYPSQNIGYGNQLSQDFLSFHRNRVYTAWRSGNRNIQESQIYPLLKKSINGRPFAQRMLKNWVKTLLKHNRFPNVTTHENYQRLSLIMRENIDKLIASDPLILQLANGKTAPELKRAWYEANRIADLSTLSTPLLKSYRTFIASLFPILLVYEPLGVLD